MRLRAPAALALLVVATGCPASTPHNGGTTDAGSASLIGRKCNVDVECGADLRCDPVRRTCICLSDANCAALNDGGTPFCDNFTGLCVASVRGCVPGEDGGPGKFCNPDTRAFEDLRGFCQECSTDVECGQGNACLNDAALTRSFCSKACTDNTGCPSGATCQDLVDGGSKQCWPDPAQALNCQTFTGCVPDSNETCDDTHPCTGAGQVCNSALGVCKAQVQICPLGTTCDPAERVCVISCTLDADCEAPKKCVNRACQFVGECQSDTDCPADKVCNLPTGATGGECVPFCTNDQSCGAGRICQPYLEPDGTYRPKCFDGCLRSSDCPLNQVCLDGSGVIFTAEDGGTTFGTCQGQINGNQACQASLACSTCQLCGTDNTCKSATAAGLSYNYCTPCDQTVTDDCSQNHGLPAGSKCLSLAGLDSQGNIIGSGPFFCGVPCDVAHNISADQATCPAGFLCAALQGAGGSNCVPTDFNCQATSTGGANKCQ